MDEQTSTGGGGQAPDPQQRPRMSKLDKVIPTERVSFDKQMSVLRAYAAASGAEKKPVSNDEVASVSGLSASSISLCNPFFNDCGLLVAEGRKQRPADAVFDYFHAHEWNSDAAPKKLFGIMSGTWAAQTLVRKLAFRQLSKDEAIQFLADTSKAQKVHRRNLETILDFLNATNVIAVEGNTVSKTQDSVAQPPSEAEKQPALADDKKADRHAQQPVEPQNDIERFMIPIPGKDPAIITIPRNLDADDWTMLSVMIETYIRRLRNEAIDKAGGHK